MKTDKYLKNYVNGTFVPADSGDYLDNFQPATGRIANQLPAGAAIDVDRAVSSARRAWSEWAACGADVRFKVLMRLADVVEQNGDAFARAECADTGYPLDGLRTGDLPAAVDHLRAAATAVLHSRNPHRTTTHPLGVAGVLLSQRHGFRGLCRLVAPALATGNCAVVKPSRTTPAAAYLLAKACLEAGLPPGVLNIVYGTGEQVGAALAAHPDVDALAAAARRAVADAVAQPWCTRPHRLHLEVDGTNAALVFGDDDAEKTQIDVLRAAFDHNGAAPFRPTHLLVERAHYAAFREALTKRAGYLKVGDPTLPLTTNGPTTSQSRLDELRSLLVLAEVHGGQLLNGGTLPELRGELAGGYYLRPAVLEGLAPTHEAYAAFTHGPVVTLYPFDDEAAAARLVNGLADSRCTSIWTNDLARVERLLPQLHTPYVQVNERRTEPDNLTDLLRFYTRRQRIWR